MGIAFSYIKRMDDLGLFHRGGMSILDIGSSNLYSATPAEIKCFLNKYGPALPTGIDEFAQRLAAGSAYDPVRGGLNEAFAGELFEKAGMQYESLDIATGFRTTILDLNSAALPAALQGKFDLVLNHGTTEHILNQFNCFSVIHNATKPGGYIYHSLPAIGYVNHGYFTYTARCFLDLASSNGYELLACWFSGPSGRNSIYDSLQSYGDYFPVLKETLREGTSTEPGRALREVSIPDIAINVVCRKVKDRPFRGALEASTSVGAIPLEVTAAYGVRFVAASTPARFRQRVAVALRRHPLLYAFARKLYRAATGK